MIDLKESVYWNSYQTIPAKVLQKGQNYLVHRFKLLKYYFFLLTSLHQMLQVMEQIYFKRIFFREERLIIITY